MSFLKLPKTAFAFLCGLGITGALAAGPSKQLGYVPGELIIKLAPSISADVFVERLRVATGGNASVKKTFKRINAIVVRVDTAAGAQSTMALAKSVSKSPEVIYAEPNYIWSKNPTALPNDEHFSDQWYLTRIRAAQGWDLQNASPNTVVAVIDTGVHIGHADLRENIWVNPGEIASNNIDDDNNGKIDDVNGWDFFNDDNDPSPELVPTLIMGMFEHPTEKRYEAHGTHVACTIGCGHGNQLGVAGITAKVQIMPLKFLGGARGSGDTADAIAAIEYALDNRAHIINASWGGGPFSQALKDMIEAAHRDNVLFVAAAGNGGSDGVGDDTDQMPHYPSSYVLPNIISVSATSKSADSRLTSFSNFGRTRVHIAAPGADILSAVPTGDENSTAPGDGYKALYGTSMATPVVSGILALIRERFPAFTPLEVRSWLFISAQDRTPLIDKVATNAEVDLLAAVQEPALSDAQQQELAGLDAATRNHVEVQIQQMSLEDRARITMMAGPSVNQVAKANPHQLDVIIRWQYGVEEAQKQEVFKDFRVIEKTTPSKRLNIERYVLEPKTLDAAVVGLAAKEHFDKLLGSAKASPLVLSIELNAQFHKMGQ